MCEKGKKENQKKYFDFDSNFGCSRLREKNEDCFFSQKRKNYIPNSAAEIKSTQGMDGLLF